MRAAAQSGADQEATEVDSQRGNNYIHGIYDPPGKDSYIYVVKVSLFRVVAQLIQTSG